MKLHIYQIPKEIIDKFNLNDIVSPEILVYTKIQRGTPG